MEACAEVGAPFEAIEVNQPAQDGTSSHEPREITRPSGPQQSNLPLIRCNCGPTHSFNALWLVPTLVPTVSNPRHPSRNVIRAKCLTCPAAGWPTTSASSSLSTSTGEPSEIVRHPHNSIPLKLPSPNRSSSPVTMISERPAAAHSSTRLSSGSLGTASTVSAGSTCFANSRMASMASAARGSDHPNFPSRCRRTSLTMGSEMAASISPSMAISRMRFGLPPNTKPER